MIGPALRVVATLILAWGLWWAWRSLRGDRAVMIIVGLGLAVRALSGAVLFWVSYLGLPVGASLQLGNGHWFYAPDGVGYFAHAERAAALGLGTIWTLDPTLPSVVYIKTLALALYLVGSVVSTAALLNLASYLATALVLGGLADATGASRPAKLFSLAAASFAPSWILWSTQPLKDTFFLMLVATFVLALQHTVRATRLGSGRLLPAVAAPVAAWLLLYGVSGIRWYFGVLLLMATSLACAATVWPAVGRRLKVSITLAAVLAVFSQAVPIGAGPYLPQWVKNVLQPWQSTAPSLATSIAEAPAHAVAVADTARLGLIASEGSTEIQLAARRADAGAAGTTGSIDGAEAFRPETAAEKIFAGGVAMFVPRAVAQRAGWIYVGGGRGLLAFADIDTVAFTASCLGSLLLVGLAFRRGLRPDPVFWGVLGLTVLITVPLAYEGSNLGTLFRQRNMVMLGFVLLPLLLGRSGDRRTSDATARA